MKTSTLKTVLAFLAISLLLGATPAHADQLGFSVASVTASEDSGGC